MTISKKNRHMVFLDLLGIRRNLSLGQIEYAKRKIIALASIAEKVQREYPDVRMHGSSDFFILYGCKPDTGWATAQAAVRIFAHFYDINDQENVKDISAAYLLRGGVAYGEVEEISKSTDEISYSFALGDGLGLAYETQCLGQGMRLFIREGASRYFVPTSKQTQDGIPGVRIDRCHAADGHVLSSEIRWVGLPQHAARRVERASILFRKALVAFRRGEVTATIVAHYQQILCAILRGCSSPKTLLRFLTFRHRYTHYHDFLAPVWATAWLRLLQPENADSLLELQDILWDKFLIVSSTR